MSNEGFNTRNVVVTLRQFAEQVQLAAATGSSIMGLGMPGIGKTEIVRQVVKDKLTSTHFYDDDFSLADLSCEDMNTLVGAFAYVDTKDEKFPVGFSHAPSDRMRRMSAGYGAKDGVLHIDEVTCVDPTLVPVINSLAQSRRYGPIILPSNTLIVLTGNREVDGHTMFSFTPVTANRMMMFEIKPDATEWMEDFAAPKNLHPWIIALTAKYRDSTFSYNPENNINCTPRSLASCSKLLDMFIPRDHLVATTEEISTVLTGVQINSLVSRIGYDKVREMVATATIFKNLPDWSEIKADPKGAHAPNLSEPLACYLAALTVANSCDKETLDQALQYLVRLPTNSMLIGAAILTAGRSGTFSPRDFHRLESFKVMQQKNVSMLQAL